MEQNNWAIFIQLLTYCRYGWWELPSRRCGEISYRIRLTTRIIKLKPEAIHGTLRSMKWSPRRLTRQYSLSISDQFEFPGTTWGIWAINMQYDKCGRSTSLSLKKKWLTSIYPDDVCKESMNSICCIPVPIHIFHIFGLTWLLSRLGQWYTYSARLSTLVHALEHFISQIYH